MSSTPPTSRLPWSVGIGSALLIGLAVWSLIDGTAASPRYPVALIALALSSVAREIAARTGSKGLSALSIGLVGAAGGLMVGGLF